VYITTYYGDCLERHLTWFQNKPLPKRLRTLSLFFSEDGNVDSRSAPKRKGN
jgi:hypothetical protein